ncbi:MAG: threonine aldolase family protein [Pseudomonadota bacterium]|nr:threonine aldolase family protein [Pseudomonadota bacterium]
MNPASIIDLRSDTVTRPTPAIRAAMADAAVGDDQYGEDALTNLLQARMADLLGKPAALWLPSGTMANQVALRVLTHPGDEVIVSRECHAAWHETGGSAANSGVQLHEIGHGGVFSAEQAEAAIETLPGPFRDFLDPWGNRIEVVGYANIQFTKAPNVLHGMGLAQLSKNEAAIKELADKAMAPD